MRTFGLFILSFAVCSFAGCKNDRNSTEEDRQDDNETSQSYTSEKTKVTIKPLEYRTFSKQLICNGRVEASEKSTISFRSSGRIAQIHVREGQNVVKGETLASLDRTELKEQFISARLAFEKAEMNLADRLLDYGYTINDTASIPADVKRTIYINTGFTDAELAFRRAARDYEGADLKAPFSGKVASITGHMHEQGGAFCTLIADNTMLVRFSVLETEYKFVKVGQKVKVSPFINESAILEGTVMAINPSVERNGQIQVTAKVKNDGNLLDGMNVRITVENEIPHQLVVDKSAVLVRDDMEILFKYVDGKSLWTYINVVMSNSTEYVVEANTERGSELSEGDLIIVSGNLNLGDDTEVEVAE